MADKTVVDVNPNVKVTDNGDNTWSVSCEDVNSDDALTALEALVVDAAAIEVATEATQEAVETQAGILITETFHPFGLGSLTTNGEQYCTAVTGIDNDDYDDIEKVTVTLPANASIKEISVSLIAEAEVDGVGNTDDVLWKWLGSDDDTSWDDLIAEQTLTNTNDFTLTPASGYVDLANGTNFIGSGTVFYLKYAIKSSGATDTVSGKTKSSSWVQVKYRLEL